jgi:hypothetical protein
MKKNKCNEKDCDKTANFNLPSENYGIYCSKHKKENMIDVKHKKCLEKDCNLATSYNFKGFNC